MNKKITYLKRMLLAVVAVMSAAGAWGGVTSKLYHRALTTDDGATVWSTDDIGDGKWVTTSGTPTVTSDNTTGLKSLGVGEIANSVQITPTANAILTIDAVWQYHGGNSDDNNEYLQIGSNIRINVLPKATSGNVTFNSTDSRAITNACSKNGETRFQDTYTIHVVINTATNKVTALTISGTVNKISTSASFTLESEVSLTDTPTYNTISMGQNNRTDGYVVLQSLKVTQETQEVSIYGYHVYYKEGENIVKTVSGSLAEGTTIPVLTALDGEGTYAGNHYLISGEAPSKAISSTESENVLNIDVRKPYTATLNVLYSYDGGEGVQQSTTALTETDEKDNSYTYVFPYYVQKDEKWYRATLKDGKFGETVTYSSYGETINKTVSYTLDDNVVYYSEHGSVGSAIAESNGGHDDYVDDVTIGTLSVGVYDITVMQIGDYTSTLYKNYSGTKESMDVTFNSEGRTQRVTISETTSDVAVANNNMRLDYVLVKKATESIEVTSVGYATLVNSYALDFSETGIKAYKAKVNTGTGAITLTQVNNVPANTPVLLYKDGGATEDIPVINSAAAVSDNDLVAGTGVAVATTDGAGNYNYILFNGTKGIGFYKANSQTVAANRAYLHTTYNVEGAPGASMMMVFADDETTGIQKVENRESRAEGYYNLNGQRVAVPTKGLYIVNGKKMIIK